MTTKKYCTGCNKRVDVRKTAYGDLCSVNPLDLAHSLLDKRPIKEAKSDLLAYFQRKADRLKHLYSITYIQYLELMDSQNYLCAICREPFTKKSIPYVDHDHSCCPGGERSCGRCVRGLLCRSCNTGLGYFRDVSESLRRAADYLDKAHVPT